MGAEEVILLNFPNAAFNGDSRIVQCHKSLQYHKYLQHPKFLKRHKSSRLAQNPKFEREQILTACLSNMEKKVLIKCTK